MIAITQQIKSDVTPEPTNKFIYVLVLTWQALISGGNQNNWRKPLTASHIQILSDKVVSNTPRHKRDPQTLGTDLIGKF